MIQPANNAQNDPKLSAKLQSQATQTGGLNEVLKNLAKIHEELKLIDESMDKKKIEADDPKTHGILNSQAAEANDYMNEALAQINKAQGALGINTQADNSADPRHNSAKASGLAG